MRSSGGDGRHTRLGGMHRNLEGVRDRTERKKTFFLRAAEQTKVYLSIHIICSFIDEEDVSCVRQKVSWRRLAVTVSP